MQRDSIKTYTTNNTGYSHKVILSVYAKEEANTAFLLSAFAGNFLAAIHALTRWPTTIRDNQHEIDESLENCK